MPSLNTDREDIPTDKHMVALFDGLNTDIVPHRAIPETRYNCAKPAVNRYDENPVVMDVLSWLQNLLYWVMS